MRGLKRILLVAGLAIGLAACASLSDDSATDSLERVAIEAQLVNLEVIKGETVNDKMISSFTDDEVLKTIAAIERLDLFAKKWLNYGGKIKDWRSFKLDYETLRSDYLAVYYFASSHWRSYDEQTQKSLLKIHSQFERIDKIVKYSIKAHNDYQTVMRAVNIGGAMVKIITM